MRYRELYEMIDMGLLKAQIAFPMSENFKNFLTDQAIDRVGETVVIKKKTVSITSGETVSVLKAPDMTSKVYKVQDGTKNLPFISEETTNPNTDETTITNNAWYVKKSNSSGSITSITPTDVAESVVTIVWTEDDEESGPMNGSYIKFSDVVGIDRANYIHPINGKTIQMTTAGSNGASYTADTNLAVAGGYSAHTGDSGRWQDESYYIHFLKAPGTDVTVYYYAKPRAKESNDSEIDLPHELVTAVAHMVIGRALSLDGQLQIGSGHKGIAMQLIGDYIQLRSRREQMPDIIPQPLTDFIYK